MEMIKWCMKLKNENHSCTIAFMKEFLSEKFKKVNSDFLKKAMQARVDTQYYSDRSIDDLFYQKIKEELKKNLGDYKTSQM